MLASGCTLLLSGRSSVTLGSSLKETASEVGTCSLGVLKRVKSNRWRRLKKELKSKKQKKLSQLRCQLEKRWMVKRSRKELLAVAVTKIERRQLNTVLTVLCRLQRVTSAA